MTVKTVSEKMGQGVGFERIRRITGYLVGTMDKWNDAKRAEERDRVKHNLNTNALSCRYRIRQHCGRPGHPGDGVLPGLSPSLRRLPQSRNLGIWLRHKSDGGPGAGGNCEKSPVPGRDLFRG